MPEVSLLFDENGSSTMSMSPCNKSTKKPQVAAGETISGISDYFRIKVIGLPEYDVLR